MIFSLRQKTEPGCDLLREDSLSVGVEGRDPERVLGELVQVGQVVLEPLHHHVASLRVEVGLERRKMVGTNSRLLLL